MAYAVVGKNVRKVDGLEKATGAASYIDDLFLPGMLWGKILRSQYPHARLVHVDVGKAKALAGVRAVIIASDLPGGLMGPFIKDEEVLAGHKVRYIGEPVAAVAATDLETAEEALGLIEVEYEELPALFDPREAMADGAPLIHADLERYVAVFPARRKGNVCSHTTFEEGEIEKGFKEAEEIFEDSFTTQMVHQSYIEPGGAVAQFDVNGKVTVWCSTQAAFVVQARIAESLHLPMTRIRVIPTKLGGGFGGKVEPSVQPICVALANKSRCPVKIILTREEEMIATRPRHATYIALKTGVKRDGTLVARQANLIYDTGAFADDGPGVTGFGSMAARGPYRIPHFRVDGYCVYTNKASTGAFRGFGNPQITFASESQLDIIAARLGIDPLEVRLKNALEKGDTYIGGQVLHSVGFKECLQRAAETAGWSAGRREPNRGLGMASLTHISGVLSTSAFVKVNEDGTVTLITGSIDIGQGSDTTLAQIAAEELAVPLEQIAMAAVDTDFSPYNWATDASRTTFTVGRVVKEACQEAKEQLLKLAAEILEANLDDLEARDAKVMVKGVPGKEIGYRELSAISHWVRGGPILGKSSLMVEGSKYPPYDPKRCVMTGFPFGVLAGHIFGAHVVEVEVDPETGKVTVLKAVAAHDVGKAINPIVVEGQIEGGLVQGIGYGLTEEIVYDGGKVVNPSFVEYRIPSALDSPPISPIIVEEPDKDGPFGAKGVGEPGLVATAPAIANAIYQAVGVRLKDLPLTPERVLKALQQAGNTN